MIKINVPYDHTSMEVALEDKNFAGKLEGQQTHFVAEKSQEDLVEEMCIRDREKESRKQSPRIFAELQILIRFLVPSSRPCPR